MTLDRTLEMATHFQDHEGVEKAYERYRTICSNPIVIQSLETVDPVPMAASHAARMPTTPVGDLSVDEPLLDSYRPLVTLYATMTKDLPEKDPETALAQRRFDACNN